MKKLFYLIVLMLFNTYAYAQDMGIFFSQATATDDVITLTCDGKVLLSAEGYMGRSIPYNNAVAILGNVNSSKCSVSVSGYDKNSNPVTIDGGTISVILDSIKQTIIYADDANFIPIKGLWHNGREIKATFAVYSPQYDVWLNDNTIK